MFLVVDKIRGCQLCPACVPAPRANAPEECKELNAHPAQSHWVMRPGFSTGFCTEM